MQRNCTCNLLLRLARDSAPLPPPRQRTCPLPRLPGRRQSARRGRPDTLGLGFAAAAIWHLPVWPGKCAGAVARLARGPAPSPSTTPARPCPGPVRPCQPYRASAPRRACLTPEQAVAPLGMREHGTLAPQQAGTRARIPATRAQLSRSASTATSRCDRKALRQASSSASPLCCAAMALIASGSFRCPIRCLCVHWRDEEGVTVRWSNVCASH